jgi:hypothetical protein
MSNYRARATDDSPSATGGQCRPSLSALLLFYLDDPSRGLIREIFNRPNAAILSALDEPILLNCRSLFLPPRSEITDTQRSN